MLIIYIYFFNKRARKGYQTNLAGLVKKRRELEFVINYIYKFKIFQLNSILFFYIY